MTRLPKTSSQISGEEIKAQFLRHLERQSEKRKVMFLRSLTERRLRYGLQQQLDENEDNTMSKLENLRDKISFEHRIMDGSADDAIRSILQIRNIQLLMQLHAYEAHHRNRRSVNRALIHHINHRAQKQKKHIRH